MGAYFNKPDALYFLSVENSYTEIGGLMSTQIKWVPYQTAPSIPHVFETWG
ncbi:hypothetical protein KSB_62660 [Ktedonobacter robiniae]|uniref:Uncharacterized protein n=1 Tax=Ktedonobacter robiniae TaxID=2778365 RepID=A0ABQ3UY55_9CHLR|nr:hypothetical protein KSB_62660 [Ktedonobacter robiniae]